MIWLRKEMGKYERRRSTIFRGVIREATWEEDDILNGRNVSP
jgi:hypothetical protein